MNVASVLRHGLNLELGATGSADALVDFTSQTTLAEPLAPEFSTLTQR
jgi:hypothetical protein